MSEAPERIWLYPNQLYEDGWIEPIVSLGFDDEDEDGPATEYVRANRIEELEVKLAKAVEALKFHNAAVELCIGEVTPAMKEAHYHTKRILAELTGGKDE